MDRVMIRQDIYARVTAQIVEAISQGVDKFQMPWHFSGALCEAPTNAVSKRPYRGINVLALWAVARKREYPSGVWATYKQWKELGSQVRSGEKAAVVVLWKANDRDEAGVDEEESDKSRRMLLARGYNVFNAAQVDGYQPPDTPQLSDNARNDRAEQFFVAQEADIQHGGSAAFYDVDRDLIILPDYRNFRSVGGYYATLAHEMTHWTGEPRRLNRNLGNRFGSASYAMEELIAELGAAFICARLQLTPEVRTDHAAYIANWLDVLKHDAKAVFTAAAKAQQAADWLNDRAQGTGVVIAA